MARFTTYLSRETNNLIFVLDRWNDQVVSGAFSNPDYASQAANQLNRGHIPSMLTDQGKTSH